MRICILSDESLKAELFEKPAASEAELVWVRDIKDLLKEKADSYFDLLFQYNQERIGGLNQLSAPVFINAVSDTLKEMKAPFIRINAWPGFLKQSILEVAVAGPEQEETAKSVIKMLGRDCRILPDEPGLVAPRVLAMIINEAHFALKEGVSTREEIDTAMKLGTNYPMGPFEWSEKIGLEKISYLLDKLNQNDERYARAF